MVWVFIETNPWQPSQVPSLFSRVGFKEHWVKNLERAFEVTWDSHRRTTKLQSVAPFEQHPHLSNLSH